MVRLVSCDKDVAFDLAGSAFGRGAHLHATPACLGKAPKRLARALRQELEVGAAELGRRLVAACDRRMAGLLLAARRMRGLAIGADAARQALSAPGSLAIVAVDAGGGIASSVEVTRAIATGRAVAWSTKAELGALLGHDAVAICTVRHAGIATELKSMRSAADAGAAAMREGAECSRCPEAR